MNSKIFILLPDGVGLKNFAFTKFKEIGQFNNLEIIYWNNTIFNLGDLNCNQVMVQNVKLNPLTDIYKNVRKHLEIRTNIERFDDTVYQSYLFPFNTNSLKNKIRTAITKFLIATHQGTNGLNKIINKTYTLEQNTPYFNACVQQLKEHNPALVVCTNQRTSLSIAPIEAAKSLGIKTACFIFSWDNLPKSMLLIDTDFYFVWSEFMKLELLKYYPHITNDQIIVTGTPQFENHFDEASIIDRATFCNKYGLDSDKEYFLYSGDDITTSPNDPLYLRDTAIAVEKLNAQGHHLGIIFRRCPVDISNRFDKVLSEYQHIIKCIDPAWKPMGNQWNHVMPTIDDMVLQANCIRHTRGVLNLGSSMVFDAIAHQKTCAYFNYNAVNTNLSKWNVEKIYKYVHFRSMPSKDAVHWVNRASDLENILLKMLDKNTIQLIEAQKWFNIINQAPANRSSERLIVAIKQII